MAPPTESFLHYIYGESNPAALLLLISAVLLSILFLVFCSFFTSRKGKEIGLDETGSQTPNTTLTRVTVRLSKKTNGVSHTDQHRENSPMTNRALPSLPETEKTTGEQPIPDPGDSLYDTLDSQPLEQEKTMAEIERPPPVKDPITKNPKGKNAKNEVEEVNKKNIEDLYSKVNKRPTVKPQVPPAAGNDVFKPPAGEIGQIIIPNDQKADIQKPKTQEKQPKKDSSDMLAEVCKNAKKSPRSNGNNQTIKPSPEHPENSNPKN